MVVSKDERADPFSGGDPSSEAVVSVSSLQQR
jgi:hypothetical protein